MIPPIAFAGSQLDRADPLRASPEKLAALCAGGGQVLRLDGLTPALSQGGRLEWDRVAEGAAPDSLLFLGLDGDVPCFAALPVTAAGADPSYAAPMDWGVMAMLPPQELALYGAARSLVSWHMRHRFCSNCGGPTVPAKGGWQRSCTRTECGAEHFPRVDPVVIMFVEHRGRALLGRQPRFPQGRYSTLAGFVEPGESIEEAVAREIFEEAGLRVRDVTYVASQPWPFPSSLMIGCHAYVDDDALTIDTTELEDARWFSRDDVADALDAIGRGENGRAFGAPPAYAIAHVLMRWWLDR